MSGRTRIPKFQLEKIYAGGNLEAPELHRLESLDPSCRMGRRGFLLTSALGAGALAALLPGCQTRKDEEKTEEPQAALPELRVDIADSLAAHHIGIPALAFHPDGGLLASGSNDQTVKLWSIPEGKLLHTLDEHDSIVDSVLFTPDGKLLISGSHDGTIKLWPAPFTQAQTTLSAGPNRSLSLAVSPDGAFLASSVLRLKDTIRLWSLPAGNMLKEMETESGVNGLAFSPDSAMLAYGGNNVDPAVSLLSVPSGELVARWTLENGRHGFPSFSPDGKLLAVFGGGGLDLLEMPSGKALADLDRKRDIGLRQTIFSPDWEWLASASDDGVLLLRKPFVKADLDLKGHKGIRSLAFSKDSRFLASGGDGGRLRVWEMLTPGDPPARLRAALFDPEAMKKNTSVQYGNRADQGVFSGRCGEPLPAGAICTCNCVSGKYTPPVPVCTCDKICTCVPVK
ncbi:MAG: WD40 repeat domain-containing protein [Desulfovibrionaceae bacterium]|nr:WD40 repeat domain-containing protein [Desulfovibrionaceae bacterium]